LFPVEGDPLHRLFGRRLSGLMMALVLVLVCLSPPVRALWGIPGTVRIAAGQHHLLPRGLPRCCHLSLDCDGIVEVAPGPGNDGRVMISSVGPGMARLDVRLFGVLPLRRVQVEVLPELRLVPGGQAIGILLEPEGVIVIGTGGVEEEGGRTTSPARDRGLRVGDVVLRVDGRPVNSNAELAEAVHRCGREGRPARLTVRRGGEMFEVSVRPALCRRSGRFRIGLYVRDGAAGVGTLTFYDPTSRRYAALGHIIADPQTRRPVDVRQGAIVLAAVSGIQPGRRGQPGEKIGIFVPDGEEWGSIDANTPFGIVGRLKTGFPGDQEPVPVALADSVHPGPAEILTVVDQQRVQRFKVEVVRVQRQQQPSSRGMVIRITDGRLLQRTGGIIQGMSGSPILQDGRLIGAVTHVFVNDPTRGYGVFVEWMLQETGLLSGTISDNRRWPAPRPAA